MNFVVIAGFYIFAIIDTYDRNNKAPPVIEPLYFVQVVWYI